MVKEVLRFPQLDTVLMVEEFIQNHSGEFKKLALWKNLPKKTMYQTFSVIIDYLLYSKKISINSQDKFVWIHSSEKKVDNEYKYLFSTSSSRKHIKEVNGK